MLYNKLLSYNCLLHNYFQISYDQLSFLFVRFTSGFQESICGHAVWSAILATN